MSDDAGRARPSPILSVTVRPPASPAALLAWLFPQVLAISIAAWRVPLATGYAGYPRPAESLAPHLMIAIQIGAVALLGALILRDVRTAVMAVATAWPFLILSVALAAAPLYRTAVAGLYVTSCLVALALWQRISRQHQSQLTVVALSAAVSIGGAALAYLRAEFSPPLPAGALASGAFGPLAAAVSILDAHAPLHWTAWLWPLLPCAAAAAILLGRARRRDLATPQAPHP